MNQCIRLDIAYFYASVEYSLSKTNDGLTFSDKLLSVQAL
jgi:hypothetical protein